MAFIFIEFHGILLNMFFFLKRINKEEIVSGIAPSDLVYLGIWCLDKGFELGLALWFDICVWLCRDLVNT